MEPETMAVVVTYPTAEVANSNAAALVEHGLGAAVEATDDGAWAVTVLPDDRTRARELLGVPDPPSEDAEDDSDELTQGVRSFLLPVLIGISVLIVVPIVAFFVSYKLSGG
jgi:hypothetical protein